MTIQNLIRIAGGAVLVLTLFFVIRAILRSQEASAEQALAVELIEEALDVHRDFSDALKLSADALQKYPEDGRLHLLRARAFHGLGRHSDALAALDAAKRLSDDADERKEIRFYVAASQILRFLETGERDDFNKAEGELKLMGEGGRFSSAARVLLGRALAQPTRYQNRPEALRLLKEGLAGDSAPEGLVNLERARKTLAELETAESR